VNILGLARHGLNDFEQIAITGVLVTAFVALFYAWMLRGRVLRKDKGTTRMQEVWDAIKIGAHSYLNRQLWTILPSIGVLAVALFFSVYVVPPSAAAVREFGAGKAHITVAVGRTVAFIVGALFSTTVGQLGMRMAIQANVRAASAARRSFTEALTIAYYAGTITGMLTDGLGLLGGTAIFVVFGTAAPDALLGFGFGGTLLALFMRVGGGIYTKAADVGADLVGKVEQDIPEDDPRNAAVVADLVGDNVGDCAGMAADVFESYEVTIVSVLILGLALSAIEPTHSLKWIVFPLIIRAVGVISSIIGTFAVPIWEHFPLKFLRARDAEAAMFRSYEVSSVNTILWSFVVATLYAGDWKLGLLTTVGVGLAVAFNPITSYFTSTRHEPVREIADATKTGAATTILSGLAAGMESSVWAVIALAVAFGFALELNRGLPAIYTLYSVAIIGIGMLSQTGNNLAMDSFGPISDNANGIAEMAWHDMDDEVTRRARQSMADLDAVGNTTKAITKGIAIASAVIAAVSLFSSFITAVEEIQQQIHHPVLTAIRVSDTHVFTGLLLGGALPWLFGSLIIRSVGRAAGLVVEEVRRQFHIPGLMEGKVRPDYARVVGISTAAAQRELIPLATLCVLVPIAIGLIFQVEALGGFLAGIILSGQLLAVFMANSGGAWDNAKKSIEDEPRDLQANTGKGSERHKASVVGDTVGDPLKDAAGPALNPMIKVVNLVSLITAPIIVEYGSISVGVVLVIVVLAAGIAWAFLRTRRPPVPLDADEPAQQEGGQA
jgi:K(+)-stimulated pyrophosphate-energized sodium pump